MLGTTRLQDYNIFTSIIREDELLLKWSIRHPRRLPGYPFYRRLLLTRQMKTALEVVSRAATNTSKIASDIIESFQRYIFRFSPSQNHLVWLSRKEEVFTARQRPIRIWLLLFLRSD